MSQKQYEMLSRNTGKSYGVIGTPTYYSSGTRELHVGDIIAYHIEYNVPKLGIIIENKELNHFTVMGWVSTPLGRLIKSEFLSHSKVISFDAIQDMQELENLFNNAFKTDFFTLEEYKKKMTLEEVEEILGHKVEIV